jgi:hypothetical protein
MVFAGFLLFFDPPKPGVRQTVADLADLGVQLKIITGDNHLVAVHTAETIGLPVTGVLTGAEINDMRDEALWQAAERTTLFCEVDPNEKERIILALLTRSNPAREALFHTGWFVESVLSAGLVVFVLRTQGPLLRSRPSRAICLPGCNCWHRGLVSGIG